MSAERRRGAALLTVSLLAHALVLGALLAIVPVTPMTPLVIDLSELDDRAGPTAASAPGAQPPGSAAPSHGAPAPAGAIARGSRAPTPRATPAPITPPPTIPAPPPPAPPMVLAPPPEPALPAPTPSSPAPPMPAPAEAPTAAPAPTPSASAPAASGPGGAAPPTADATGSGTSGAPRAGTGAPGDPGGVGGQSGSLLALARPGEGGVPAEYGPYLTRFRQRVEAALVYPLSARRSGRGGRVELEVLLEPSGRVRRVEVAQSSASAALDEAAVDAVRSVAPIPFPEGLPRRPLLLRLPLIFELR